ncbi:MAG TPA: hypothetical protein VKB86_13725 [Pyrinomonadaceae bacterium]|nr:hypothetical protein [Pyrinomonadaceae bacterium]
MAKPGAQTSKACKIAKQSNCLFALIALIAGKDVCAPDYGALVH